MEEPNDDIHFSDAELHAYLNRALGIDKELPIEERPNPDPGTITSTELRKRYGLPRSRAEKLLDELQNSDIIRPEWIKRYDPWSGNKKKIKGYRFYPPEEKPTD